MVVQELESQLWSAELLQPARIEQSGKDYESALEGQECFVIGAINEANLKL